MILGNIAASEVEIQMATSSNSTVGIREGLVAGLKRVPNLTLFRNAWQVAFALFVLYVGWRFYLFVAQFITSTPAQTAVPTPAVPRPPAVEGFLPISALMGLKLWITTGIFDPIHPAGLVLLTTIISISLLFKKAFCSWLCPVGTLSEFLGRAGAWFFGRNLSLPDWLDYPLRTLKYLVLAFFIQIIIIDMDSFSIASFLGAPYNKIADVKMLRFFLRPSQTTIYIVVSLAIASILVRNFWCRYLCPYGALLGLASLVSPLKVRRDDSACTHCGKCARVCPNRVPVDKLATVQTPECTACLDCVAACPARGALSVRLPARTQERRIAVSGWVFATLVLGVFFGAIILAQVIGHWQTAVSMDEFAQLIPQGDRFLHF